MLERDRAKNAGLHHYEDKCQGVWDGVFGFPSSRSMPMRSSLSRLATLAHVINKKSHTIFECGKVILSQIYINRPSSEDAARGGLSLVLKCEYSVEMNCSNFS